jgi:hypothetical protein
MAYSNHQQPRNKYSSEARYIEAKNEIPRFNEDFDKESTKSRSVFKKMNRLNQSRLDELDAHNESQSYLPLSDY